MGFGSGQTRELKIITPVLLLLVITHIFDLFIALAQTSRTQSAVVLGGGEWEGGSSRNPKIEEDDYIVVRL